LAVPPADALTSPTQAGGGATQPGGARVTAPPDLSAPAIPAPHELKAVRVRPLADALRLVFLLDRPAPYTVRLDPSGPRAELTLINVRAGYLPPELTSLGDPRLSGIWLKQADAGVTLLELRLATPKIKIEHFMLENPPAIVLDLTRTDQAAAYVSGGSRPAPALASAPASTAGAPDSTAGAEEAALPADLLGPGGGPGASSSEPAVILDPSTSPTLASEGESPTPDASAPAADATSPTVVDLKTIGPEESQYDYFPIHDLKISSPLGEEIKGEFLDQRWASVLEKGIKYLELNRINAETATILHLMAEARWQLGGGLRDQPLTDLMNFYQQALRGLDGGDLGAFAHWRLGQLRGRMAEHDGAVEELGKAWASSSPVVRRRAAMLRIKELSALRQYDAALATVAALDQEVSDTQTRLELRLCEGSVRLDKGDAAGALASYEAATKLDPKWIDLNFEGGGAMARAAMEAGRLDRARSLAEPLINGAGYQNEDQRVQLALLYADILARQGDLATAEEMYAKLLIEVGRTPKGAAIQQKMMALHPRDMIEGVGHYCTLLWRRGQIRPAMAELNHAYQQSLRAGLSTAPLAEAIEQILPSFMEDAVPNGHASEALAAWRAYGQSVKKPAQARRCALALADALEALGLDDEALTHAIQLARETPRGEGSTAARLALMQARLLNKLERPAEALALLDALEASCKDPAVVAQIDEQRATACLKTGQPLEAAQVWQNLSRRPGVTAKAAGEALMRAGELFLDQGLAVQTLELGLKGLILEKQALDRDDGGGWDPHTGSAMRLMLARAYQARGDTLRAMIVLDAAAQRSGLSGEDKAQATMMIGDCRRRLGQGDAAGQAYQALAGDTEAPGPWRTAAGQWLKVLAWDRAYPQWKIERPAPRVGP